MKHWTRRLVWVVLVAFLVNTVGPSRVHADVSFLPAPGKMLSLTQPFSPLLLRGIKLHKFNPFKFDFIVDTGDIGSEPNSSVLKDEGKKLASYFFASLTIPEKDMWVNLSPYEKDRTIMRNFGGTEMGKEVLAQDYILKQVTASVMYPEGEVGKRFWKAIYNEAYKKFGTTNIPVDFMNKVWLVPDKAVVFENTADNSVVVVESTLKVMLEEDYLAQKKHKAVLQSQGISPEQRKLSNDMIRRIIIPVLAHEVNSGSNFAPLRQVYNSLILAKWFKDHLKQSLLGQGYIDRNKILGVNVEDKNVNREIYQQYLKAFRKGVYNYIKEEIDVGSHELVPRKYFSGGLTFGGLKVSSISGVHAAQLAAKKISPYRTVLLGVAAAASFSLSVAAISPSASAATYDETGAKATVAQYVPHLGQPRDTLSGIFYKAPALQQLVQQKGPYPNFQALLNSRAITFQDAKGHIIKNPKANLILPTWTINFNLDALGVAAQQGAATTPPDPETLPVVKAPEKAPQKVQAAKPPPPPKTRSVKAVPAPTEKPAAVPATSAAPAPAPDLPADEAAQNALLSQLNQQQAALSDMTLKMKIHPALVKNLIKFQDELKKNGQGGFKIPNGIRTHEYTHLLQKQGYKAATGGCHEQGRCADLLPTGGMTLSSLAAAAVKFGFKIESMEDAENHVHVEVPQAWIKAYESLPNAVGLPNGIYTDPENQMKELLQYQAKLAAAINKDKKAMRVLNPQEIAAIQTQIEEAQKKAQAAEKLEAEEAQSRDPNTPIIERPDIQLSSPQIPSLSSVTVPINVKLKGSNEGALSAKLSQQMSIASKPVSSKLPVSGQAGVSYNQPLVGKTTAIGHGGLTFSIAPALPFNNALTGAQIIQGWTNFGALSTVNQVMGPLVFAQILAEIRNYAATYESRGQTFRYDTRQNFFESLAHTLLLNITPYESHDQYNRPVSGNVLNVGPMQFIQAVLGAIDKGLGDTSFLGDSNVGFPGQDNGFVVAFGQYHKAFNYRAAVNTDPNAIFLKMYRVVDPQSRYYFNGKGWSLLEDNSVRLAPHQTYRAATVMGFELHFDPRTNQMTSLEPFEDPVFITDTFAHQLAANAGPNGAGGYLPEFESSVPDLEKELMLSRGQDRQGRIIYGALRDSLGHIAHFVTSPQELLSLPAITNKQGNVIRFVPGPSAPLPEGNMVGDYFKDQIKGAVQKYAGLFGGRTYASEYSEYANPRPQGTAMPVGLNPKEILVLDSGPIGKAMQQQGNQYDGFVLFFNGPPAALKDMKAARLLSSLGPANGVRANGNGMYTVEGAPLPLDGKTMVLLEPGGRVVGIVEASNKARQQRILDLQAQQLSLAERIKGLSSYGIMYDANMKQKPLTKPSDLKGFTPAKFAGVVGQKFGRVPKITADMMVLLGKNKEVVAMVEPGYQAALDRKLVLETLINGGFEVEDLRQGGKIIYFGKGDLTNKQIVLGIHSEKELVELIESGQAVMVDVPGTDKKRYIILKEKPPSRFKNLEQQNPDEPESSAQPSRAPESGEPVVVPVAEKIPTLTGPDGKTLHGVSIDAQVFTAANIKDLDRLNANAVRSYFPIPVELAAKMVKESKVRTIIVDIPLNASSYGSENLTTFWGGAVPQGSGRISLTDNNYLDYLKRLTAAVRAANPDARVDIEVLNEPNLRYHEYVNKAPGEETTRELFDLIKHHVEVIHSELGPDVQVITTLADLTDHPQDLVMALQTGVNAVGINYYRHTTSIIDDILRAYREAGVRLPVFFSEAGEQSKGPEGPDRQLFRVNEDLRVAAHMGIGSIFMSLQDNLRKTGIGEQHWGLKKPAFDALSNAWSGNPVPPLSPEDLRNPNSILKFLEGHALVRYQSDHPARTTTEEAKKKDLPSEWISVKELNAHANLMAREGHAVEILKLDARGNTIGRYVKMFDGGYALWDVVDMDMYLKTHALVIRKDKSAEYVPIEQLSDFKTHEAVRQAAKDIEIRDKDENVTGRIFLNRDRDSSRIEIVNGNTSKIYELVDRDGKAFAWSNVPAPVEETAQWTTPDGLLHVKKTELLKINQGISVEDVFKPVPNDKPDKLYSVRPLTNEIVYFKNGHEYYSVSTDTAAEPGVTVIIDGAPVEHVTGVFQFAKTGNVPDEGTGLGWHVSLKDMKKKAYLVPIRRTEFREGQRWLDQTGRMKFTEALTYEQILANAQENGLLTMQDAYTYNSATGKVKERKVSFNVKGNLEYAHKIVGGAIATQPALVSQLTKNDLIAKTFDKYGLDDNTVLVQASSETTQGVKITDYRVYGDIQERKFITVIEQGGTVFNVLVGLDFNVQSGEQTLALEMTPDMEEVRYLRRTVENIKTLGEIMPEGLPAVYAQVARKHYGRANADLLRDIEPLGVTSASVLDQIERIPFQLQTKGHDPQEYLKYEEKARKLVEEYMSAAPDRRRDILAEMREMVRTADANSDTHYTDIKGKPTTMYLLPNDARARPLMLRYESDDKEKDGDVEFDLWHMEGDTVTLTNGDSTGTKLPPNILPGNILVDKHGKLKQSMLYKNANVERFTDRQGQDHQLSTNVYKVLDAPYQVTMTITAAGVVAHEETLLARTRILNHWLQSGGDQLRGNEKIDYDIYAPRPLPLTAALDEDGRITKLTLGTLEFIANEQTGQIIKHWYLQPRPTGPKIYEVHSVQMRDGAPIFGTEKQLDLWPSWGHDLKKFWYTFFIVPIFTAVVLMTGQRIGNKRLAEVKKRLIKDRLKRNEAPDTGARLVPRSDEEIKTLFPKNWDWQNWKSYGRSAEVVAAARAKFEGSILPALRRGESDEDILNREFEPYQVWRKTNMGIQEKFTPTMEDLWVWFLIIQQAGIFTSNFSKGLQYLFHKSLEIRAQGKDDQLDGFIKKQYTLWGHFIQLQQTFFRGIDGGDMKNVVPYDNVIEIADLNDLFSMKSWVDWFDGPEGERSYSLDGQKDLRTKVYNDLLINLASKAAAFKHSIVSKRYQRSNFNELGSQADIVIQKLLEKKVLEVDKNGNLRLAKFTPGDADMKDGYDSESLLARVLETPSIDEKKFKEIFKDDTEMLKDMDTILKILSNPGQSFAEKYNKNVFRMKTYAPRLQEYRDYIKFFREMQLGRYKPAEEFDPDQKRAAERWINGKPLLLKTASESGLWMGSRWNYVPSLPLLVRYLKPAAQYLRNSFNAIQAISLSTLGTGMAVGLFEGYINVLSAVEYFGGAFLGFRGIYYIISWLLDSKLNKKAFGVPQHSSAGFKRPAPDDEQMKFRRFFWPVAILAKTGWDSFLYHYFWIVHGQTIGSTWNPHIFGYELPLDLNGILMVAAWSIPALFLFLSTWSAFYFFGAPAGYIQSKIRGLGTIKSGEDIIELQKNGVLNGLIEEKLLPHRGAEMSEDQRANARRKIWDFILDSMLRRTEISYDEWKAAKHGDRLDHFVLEDMQSRITSFVNSMTMDMPEMPYFDDIRTFGFMTPYFEEDIIYPWERVDRITTSLNVMGNTGYTPLNYMIFRYSKRWENFIEKVEREKKENGEPLASPEEIAKLRELLPVKGRYGNRPVKKVLEGINDDLILEIRLWGTNQGQGYARTLDGLMNNVRVLQLLAEISHPELDPKKKKDKKKIQQMSQDKFQMIWAHQQWGDMLLAKPDRPDRLLKKADTFYLLKKYKDELGYDIDLVSLQKKGDNFFKVLSRYDESTGETKDIWPIELTGDRPITLEGKPSNQMHAFSFARNEVTFTVDMNQDLFAAQALKMPILLQEFNDPNVAVVNYPEMVATGGFSNAAWNHAIQDRTFAALGKMLMALLSSPFHHGHPDGWRTSFFRGRYGVSSTTAVSEDYKGGQNVEFEGGKIKQVSYIELEKHRELSWTGTEGIQRKFSMGSGQEGLSRDSKRGDEFFKGLERIVIFLTGPKFYFQMALAVMGLLWYSTSVMLGGVGMFAAFPAGLIVAMAGNLVVGQSIAATGFYQSALEKPIAKALLTFAWTFPILMVPFHMSHLFTLSAGFLSGLAGVAAYVATGRGFNREHQAVDIMAKAYAKSHFLPSAIGLGISNLAIYIWWNWTFTTSAATLLVFYFGLIMPTVTNPGNYPNIWVSPEKSFEFFKQNTAKAKELLVTTFQEGLANGNFRSLFIDLPIYAMYLAGWWMLTAPVLAIIKIFLEANKKPVSAPPAPPADAAMTSEPEEPPASAVADQAVAAVPAPTVKAKKENPGGIDISQTKVQVKKDGKGVTSVFDDPAMLQLLLKADGISPVIYEVTPMTPPMINHLIGLDNPAVKGGTLTMARPDGTLINQGENYDS